MRYFCSIALCAILLMAVSLGAVVAAPILPPGYSLSYDIVPNYDFKPGGVFLDQTFPATNNSTSDIVIADASGTVVGSPGAPTIDDSNSFNLPILPGETKRFLIGSTFLPNNAAVGTVYTYTVNHYVTVFTPDYKKMWNPNTGVWDDNINLWGYPFPDYHLEPNYAIALDPFDFTITIVPEPASAIALLAGIGSAVGLFRKRRN